MLVTLPGIHATQHLALVEELNRQRAEDGRPPMSPTEAYEVIANAVDLDFEEDRILIRPIPDNLGLMFAADEALQTLASKVSIEFSQATDHRVLQALKQRGECWRISPLPQTPSEILEMIKRARNAILGKAIYYRNRFTGTRILTYGAFCQLGQLPPDALARHLQEIQEFAVKKNELGQPEIAFFQTAAFGAEAFAGHDFARLNPAELGRVFERLSAQFKADVPPEFQNDDPADAKWRQAMFKALVGQRDQTVTEAILLGLSPEYFLRLQWLPGCHIERGEFLCDSVFDEFAQSPDRQELAELCDPKVKQFIFNAVREYGELEYMNVARIPTSLSRPADPSGRREVYLAEIKLRQQPQPVVRVIRMQKYDVAGHLDRGKNLPQALLEAAEYTDYVLNRRLACRQLGMNLPPRIQMHRLSEVYGGSNKHFLGLVFWSTYFERDYCAGIATSKISQVKLANPAYALGLARWLGKAAAPNLIVGRQDHHYRVLFDDGDEIVREEAGRPVEIVVADATGAFADYTHELDDFAKAYAGPVVRRWPHLPAPWEFAEAYLEAFIAEFARIQDEYAKRRRTFDALFRHYKENPKGNLAYRWRKVLERLQRTDPKVLADGIRKEIRP